MKTILLPTDFSANSMNAIHYAIALFGEKFNYILLHAYRISPVSIEDYVTEIPDFARVSEEGLQKLLKAIHKKFPKKKLKIETLSKLGYPVEVMNKTVKRKKADLVVMGTKGASGIKEVLIGSITADAIKNLSCPVLAVPEKTGYEPVQTIALALDLKNSRKEQDLETLLFIAKKYASDILLLHIRKKPEQSEYENAGIKQIEKALKNHPYSLHSIEEHSAVNGIENFIRSRKIDMVAAISRKHTLIENIFNKSVTKKLAMHVKIPLLVLQN